jgi:hypothetical protein
MIGLEVVAEVHIGGYRYEVKKGTVIDKYIGVKSIKQEVPNGVGGKTNINSLISVDFYIIYSSGSIYHAECSRVKEVIYTKNT